MTAGRRPGRFMTGGALLLGACLLCGAVAVRSSGTVPDGWWDDFMRRAWRSGESYAPAELYQDAAFVDQAGRMASRALLVGGATCIAVALLLAARAHRPARWLLLGLAVAETFLVARGSLDSFDIARLEHPDLKRFLEAHPGDSRILDLSGRDIAFSLDAQDVWGYNPTVTLRYSQLLGFTQGVDPDRATQYIPFSRDHALLGMFRCRFVVEPQADRLVVRERTGYLPLLSLVQRHRVLTGRDAIFSALTAEGFDPSEEVILESEPDPAPRPASDPGTVTLVDSSTDHLTIEADVGSPAILLVTDAYARGWQARALPGSAQAGYRVMPANYCLRAIPLSAGKHAIRLEYLPRGFLVGSWVSLISIAGFLALTGLQVARSARKESPAAGKSPP